MRERKKIQKNNKRLKSKNGTTSIERFNRQTQG